MDSQAHFGLVADRGLHQWLTENKRGKTGCVKPSRSGVSQSPYIKSPKDNFSFICLVFVWPLARPKIARKGRDPVAASAASPQGGCASSRLDHGLKFYLIRGGCASSGLIFTDSRTVANQDLPSVRMNVPPSAASAAFPDGF